MRALRPFCSVVVLACLACSQEPDGETRFNTAMSEIVPDALWLECNRGRRVVGDDGFFVLPEHVNRVWIDVGAHHMETTAGPLSRRRKLAVIAIEPMAEAWKEWPESDRLIGVPVAIGLERGMQDFHINASDVTSSLLESVLGTPFDEAMKTVEVRSVAVLRLEDVLERIPPRFPIGVLKTDVQGMDLQVLKSAGDQIRRVRRVRAEIINANIYKKAGPESMSSEAEFHAYMRTMGFSLERETPTPEREWLDADYINDHWTE